MGTLPPRGDLGEKTLVRLFLDLSAARFSGTLLLERGRTNKQVGWQGGAPVTVESSQPSERLSALLVRSGAIEDADARRVREEVAERGCAEATAIVGLELVPPKSLFAAIRNRIVRACVDAMAWPDGRFELDPKALPPSDAKAFRCDPIQIAHSGLIAHVRCEALAADLMPRAAAHPNWREDGAEHMRRLGGDTASVMRAVALVDGKRKLETALGALFASPHALAALWLADASGWIDYAQAPSDGGEGAADAHDPIEIEVLADGAASARVAPRAAARAATARPSQAATEAIEKEVHELHSLLDELDLYQFLGVERNAKAVVIKKAYFKAAKRYHPDKLASLGLESCRDISAEVFARFAEAYEVLGDADRRADYDAGLAGGGGAADMDLARLAQSEGFYLKGEVLIKMGDFRGAAEVLTSAVELWPDECIYQASLGWSLYKKNPPDPEGAQAALERAVALDAENAQAQEWLGLVLRSAGREAEAAKALAKAKQLGAKRR